jgi:hypothetical protein|tara:strand:- start:1368 stop:1625 length:258 start_codon:yes stop_codon:yes gene_type:complete
MYSIADLIDKLVIENIKIFSIRDKLHEQELTDKEYVFFNEKMMALNENRGIISKHLDEKIDGVIEGTQKNIFLKTVKTYGMKSKK